MKKAIALALVAIMPFSNPIIGGDDTLIREKMQSENFVAGLSGWQITRAGAAEFADLVSRGSLIAGPNPGTHIEVNGTAYPGQIALFSGNANELTPGIIKPILSGGNTGNITLHSPVLFNGAAPAELMLEGFDNGNAVLSGEADTVRFTAGSSYNVIADPIILGDSTNNGDLVVTADPNGFHQIIKNQDETWHSVPLINSWAAAGGTTVDYYKDATGRVQIRGQIVSGTSTTINTALPSGYRPTQAMEWIMRGVGGVILCAVSMSTGGVMTVTANAATAQGSGIKLDAITYPTF